MPVILFGGIRLKWVSLTTTEQLRRDGANSGRGLIAVFQLVFQRKIIKILFSRRTETSVDSNKYLHILIFNGTD